MYALWLMPDKANHEELSALIRDLSNKFGSPLFEPHVTLLGKIRGIEEELERNTRTLANQLTAIDVCASRIDCENTFYKSLFLDIERSKFLDQANLMARKLFDLTGDYQWKPHLSLLYGKQSKRDKEMVINDLLPQKEFHIELNTLQLINGFGSPEEWRVLASVALMG